jgi:pyruvate kinase
VHDKTNIYLVSELIVLLTHFLLRRSTNIDTLSTGKLSVNVVTPKDAKDLEFIASLNPEYVAASFVGYADDVRKVRDTLAKHGNADIKIIAKMERPVALENLDEIIQEADALMVARGDLGVGKKFFAVMCCRRVA